MLRFAHAIPCFLNAFVQFYAPGNIAATRYVCLRPTLAYPASLLIQQTLHIHAQMPPDYQLGLTVLSRGTVGLWRVLSYEYV